MTGKSVGAIAAAAVLLLSGCSPDVISCPPAKPTGSQTTAATIQSSTTPVSSAATTATTTTAGEPATAIPTARELLGQTYGDFLALAGGSCRIIHARGHTDVAFGLESDAMPYYELPESDAAFKDWEQAVALAGEGKLSAEDVRKEQIITHVYVKEGGFVTDELAVGTAIENWKKPLPALPEMTILYDYTKEFNRGFYGRIQTTIDGANAILYIDLTTDQATKALADREIVFGGNDADQWLGKTVSLPELPVGGVRLWLHQQG